ncbi:MAG TPA: hypothetical protein GX530_08955 [Corynebacteriales bacterium]|nr:hypothetical protein [Mycobacteriales bacterium]
MKIVQLNRYFVNIDRINYIDLSTFTIYMDNGIELKISEEILNLFIKKYNEINTNEFENSIKILADTLSRNSDLLTKRQLREQIIIAVRMNDLEDYLKEIAGGERLQDMSITKLVKIHRMIKTKVQSDHLELPF